MGLKLEKLNKIINQIGFNVNLEIFEFLALNYKLSYKIIAYFVLS